MNRFGITLDAELVGSVNGLNVKVDGGTMV